LFFFFFLAILGFELGASLLLGRCSTTWATLPALLPLNKDFHPCILDLFQCFLPDRKVFYCLKKHCCFGDRLVFTQVSLNYNFPLLYFLP
jgi:hypothetical protein